MISDQEKQLVVNLKKIIKHCVKGHCFGFGKEVDGYYVTFGLRKLNPKCKNCKREL